MVILASPLYYLSFSYSVSCVLFCVCFYIKYTYDCLLVHAVYNIKKTEHTILFFVNIVHLIRV